MDPVKTALQVDSLLLSHGGQVLGGSGGELGRAAGLINGVGVAGAVLVAVTITPNESLEQEHCLDRPLLP